MAAPLLAAGIILYKHPPPVPLGPKYLTGLSHAAGLHVVIHGTVGAHPSSVARPAGETEVPEANGSGSASPGNRRPAREASKHRRLTTDRRPLTPTVSSAGQGGGGRSDAAKHRGTYFHRSSISDGSSADEFLALRHAA